MEEISLALPESLVESLPEDGENAARDMQHAVNAWERRLNELVESVDDDEVDGALVDALERFEERYEQYDDFVAELRAWGQSPIYAMSWRNLHGSIIEQLFEHEEIADRINRERHARLAESGFRL